MKYWANFHLYMFNSICMSLKPSRYTLSLLKMWSELAVSRQRTFMFKESPSAHGSCFEYVFCVYLCLLSSLRTLCNPPLLTWAMEATSTMGTNSWFFIPISTAVRQRNWVRSKYRNKVTFNLPIFKKNIEIFEPVCYYSWQKMKRQLTTWGLQESRMNRICTESLKGTLN